MGAKCIILYAIIQPTIHARAAKMRVDSSVNRTRRCEMRQKCRTPLDAMTLSRLLNPDPWAKHTLWQALILVWKPHKVIKNTRWMVPQKNMQTTKAGIIRYNGPPSDSSPLASVHLQNQELVDIWSVARLYEKGGIKHRYS